MREALKNHINDILNDEPVLPREIAVEKYTDALMQFFSTEHAAQVEEAVRKERERIEAVFMKEVPLHGLSLEDSVWLKRLLNKAFGHESL